MNTPQHRLEIFVAKSKQVHNNKYDYSLVQYVNVHVPVEIICPIHKQFFQKPINHMRGRKCPQCANQRSHNNQKLTLDMIVQRLQQLNSNRIEKVFLCDNQQYVNANTNMKFTCGTHEWHGTCNNILLKKSTCPQCKENYKLTINKIIDSLIVLNSTRYNKVYIERNQLYVNNKTKMMFYCDNDHTWLATCADIINAKTCCPYCNNFYSIKETKWLDQIEQQHNIKIQRQYKIPSTRYHADGYCLLTNTIYEFYGDLWHGNPKIYNGDDIIVPTHKTQQQLYQCTVDRELKIKQLNYNIITIWESDFDQLLSN